MKPLVVLVPDVFGSHLRDAAGRVWVDDEALAAVEAQVRAASRSRRH